jgi:hypothetical protein
MAGLLLLLLSRLLLLQRPAFHTDIHCKKSAHVTHKQQ